MFLEHLLKTPAASDKLDGLTPSAKALLEMRLLQAFLQPDSEFEVLEVIETIRFGYPIEIVTLDLGDVAVALAFGPSGRIALLDFAIIDPLFESPAHPVPAN